MNRLALCLLVISLIVFAITRDATDDGEQRDKTQPPSSQVATEVSLTEALRSMPHIGLDLSPEALEVLGTREFAAASANVGHSNISGQRIAFSEDEVDRRFGFNSLSGRMILSAFEVDPISQGVHQMTHGYGIGIRVLDVASRTSHEVYLSGVTPQGVSILQRWIIGKVPGEFRSDRAKAPAPIGTSFLTPATTFGIVGGTYIPPEDRARPFMTKQIIWSGSTAGPFDQIDSDPDGRYIIAFSEKDAALYQIDAAGALTVLLDQATIPDMASVVSMSLRDHDDLGRTICLNVGILGSNMCILLGDLDNDGIFEFMSPFTSAQFDALDLRSGWAADYKLTY